MKESTHRLYEVDVLGDGTIVWQARWDGGDTILLYRGTNGNNVINVQHIVTKQTPRAPGMTEQARQAQTERTFETIASTMIHELIAQSPMTNKDLQGSAQYTALSQFANRHPNPRFWGADKSI